MKRYSLFVVPVCFAILYSCQKNGDNKSNMELITSSAWKYDTASIDINQDGTAETPLPPGFLLACDADNTVTLNTDGSGVVNEGGTKCSPANPQTVNITWSFKDNEKVINIPDTIFGGISGDAQIKILNSTKLRLLKQVTIQFGIPITANVIVDLKH